MAMGERADLDEGRALRGLGAVVHDRAPLHGHQLLNATIRGHDPAVPASDSTQAHRSEKEQRKEPTFLSWQPRSTPQLHVSQHSSYRTCGKSCGCVYASLMGAACGTGLYVMRMSQVTGIRCQSAYTNWLMLTKLCESHQVAFRQKLPGMLAHAAVLAEALTRF